MVFDQSKQSFVTPYCISQLIGTIN